MTPTRNRPKVTQSHDQPFTQAGKQASRQAGKRVNLVAVIGLLLTPCWAVAQQNPLLNPNAAQQQGAGGIHITIDPPDGFLVEGPLPGNEENEEVHVIIPDPDHDFGTPGNEPPAIINVELTFVASAGRTLIQPAPAGGGNQATVAGPLGRFEEESIPWEISPDASDPEDQPTGTVTLVYVTGLIVPAEGQRGETGDMVESILGETGQRHYVSPRKPPSLPDGYEEHINTDSSVQLTFEGISREDFDQHLEWELLDGMLIPMSESPLVLVPRSEAAHFPVRVLLKETGTPVALLNTWIVWVELNVVVAPPDNQGEFEYFNDDGRLGFTANHTTIAVINPELILEEGHDVPDLTGAPSIDSPEVASGQRHHLLGDHHTNPRHKWNIARQIRIAIDAPDITVGTTLGIGSDHSNVNKGGFLPADGPKVVPDNVPVGPDHYPTDPLLGTDTSHLDPLNPNLEDPYHQQPPGLGSFADTDRPSHLAAHVGGQVGSEIRHWYHFRSFCRLEIAGKWYLVSPYVLHIHRSHKIKRSETDDDIDYNGDGLIMGSVWTPHSSESSSGHNNHWPIP